MKNLIVLYQWSVSDGINVHAYRPLSSSPRNVYLMPYTHVSLHEAAKLQCIIIFCLLKYIQLVILTEILLPGTTVAKLLMSPAHAKLQR
jgi:hypothetical protein